MDRVQILQVYVQVVNSGSFSKAAESLNLHVSAVSKAVKYLENQLGSRLLNRTTRTLALTGEGEAFYEEAQSLLARLESTFNDLSGSAQQAKGKLRVEMSTAVAPFVIARLPEFQRQYPDIQLILTANDEVSNLIDDGLDCTIRMGHLDDASYIARPLAEMAMITCAAPHYLAEHGTPDDLDSLNDHAIVHYVSGKQRKILPWQFTNPQGESETFRTTSATQINDSTALLNAALAGLGIVQMPALAVAPYLQKGELVQVLPKLASSTRPIWLIYPQRQFIPKRLEVFIEWGINIFKTS